MRLAVLIIAGVLMLAGTATAKLPEAYLNEAGEREAAGDIASAVAVLEPGLAEHPDNAAIQSKLGVYLATQAGQTRGEKDVILLIMRAFDLLDRAVTLEPGNIEARMQRGIIYMQVPGFLNRYDTGIEDLEFVMGRAEAAGGAFPPDILIGCMYYLGVGYHAANRDDDARRMWTRVTELAAGSPIAQQAQDGIAGLTDVPAVGTTARDMLAEVPGIAELNRELADDPDNPELLMALLRALEQESEEYDERTYTDTSFRTLMALESISVADRLLVVSDDPELRLDCASLYVEMPFFVNRLDRGIAELQSLLDSGAPDAVKAQAAYMLGYAWRKKATTVWIDLVTDYPRTEVADMALEAMYPRPGQTIPGEITGPAAVVEFDLGFRDELEPQTAVWIENSRGEYVRSLYVSGFCGHAREKQVDLPRWSQASDYVDADAVTAASIDTGRHTYQWDCRDAAGKLVPAGDYTVKIECSWWPSMQYERLETVVNVGGPARTTVAEPGRFIPWFTAGYVPAK